MKIVSLRSSDSDPTHLKERYYALRAQVFDAMTSEGHLYPKGADSYDERSTTHYYFAVEGEELLGGARMVSRKPNSDEKLPFEEKFPHVLNPRRILFPHLDYDTLPCCEYTGLVVDPEARQKGVGRELHDALLKDFAEGKEGNKVLLATSAHTSQPLFEHYWPEKVTHAYGPPLMDGEYELKTVLATNDPVLQLTPPPQSRWSGA